MTAETGLEVINSLPLSDMERKRMLSILFKEKQQIKEVNPVEETLFKDSDHWDIVFKILKKP